MPAYSTASTIQPRPGVAPLILGGPVKVTCPCNACKRIFLQPEKRWDSYSSSNEKGSDNGFLTAAPYLATLKIPPKIKAASKEGA